ncbi:Uncharacterized protein Adt_15353 [Abeliophyllum distichum]|uniref:Uncharacterized protein n=1 Tax=Abeliophyllum distichum TaxID=126358 RepID=A0ABD1U275_9LAMI
MDLAVETEEMIETETRQGSTGLWEPPSLRNNHDHRRALCRRAHHELMMKLREGSKRRAHEKLAGQMMVDDGSTVNILFDSAFDQMDVDHELIAISEPLFNFTRDSLVSQGRIILTVDFREPLCYLRKFMEFLIVDTHSAYHGVFRRPALKDLQAITSIHHLAMKFSKPRGVAKIRGNQTEVRVCYMNALRKVAKREEVIPVVMTIHLEPINVDHKEMDEEMILDEGLDLRIIGSDSLASPVEELEAFPVNPSELT